MHLREFKTRRIMRLGLSGPRSSFRSKAMSMRKAVMGHCDPKGDSMRTSIFLSISITALTVVLFFMPTSAAAVGVGKTCGGLVGIKCDEGLWCDPAPGMCGGADIQGKCVQTGFVCYMLYQPVCGCNNKTYSNDCWR